VISCEQDLNLDVLVATIWQYLDLNRCFTKRKGFPPDFEDAIILRNGTTVEGICKSIHRSLVDEVCFQ
jgi:ribosome-interacting GTPase 1